MSVTRYFKPGVKARILAGNEPGWLSKLKRRAYVRACILSCPPWVERRALYALADTAKRVSLATGVPHVLDHIVPVTHPYVCGLTVPWNLRIVTAKANANKSNKWTPDQPDLFIDQVPENETYHLF